MILPDTGANQADRLIVVGGVAAGMSAAARAKRTDPDIEVVVFEKTAHVSYGACGFPFLIAGTVKDPLDLVAIDAETFRRDRGIDVRTDHEVVELDPVSKIVTAQNRHSGESVTLNYSKLVLSTGGSPRTLGLQGIDRPNVFSLRSLEDAISLKGYIDRTSPKRAVIVGAGYIGLEMAEAFAAHGIAVTIVQRSHRLLGAIDDEISEVVAHELDRNGVHVVYGAQLSRLVGDGTDGPVSAVVCDDVAGPIPTDLVLVAVGVGADSKLAQQAGIRLGATGAIAVNWKQETNVPDIYAAGDCAEVINVVTGKPVHIPLGTTANKQGRIAGENAAGGYGTFKGVVGTAIVKVFDLEMARTGLSLSQTEAAGRPAKAVSITAGSRSKYFPGYSDITVRLVFEPTRGTLLGGQIVGGDGAGMRIDTLAATLHAGMTVEDLSRLDLAYAPPFAPVWDPLLIAAGAALKEL